MNQGQSYLLLLYLSTMALAEEKDSSNHLDVSKSNSVLVDVTLADDARLAELGYKGEFKREFSVWLRYPEGLRSAIEAGSFDSCSRLWPSRSQS